MKRLVAHVGVIALAGGLLMAGGSAAHAASTSVWTQNAADRAFQSSTPLPGAPSDVKLYAARNEYEAAQILVRSDVAGAVAISPGPLVGPGGATIGADKIEVTIERTHTDVEVVEGGQLPPGVGGAPTTASYTDSLERNETRNVAANITQPYWYSVYVPAGQAPGEYSGSVSVTSPAGTRTVPVSLRVYSATLPPTDQSTFSINNWFGSAGWDYTGTEQGIPAQYENAPMYSPNWWRVIENIAKNHAAHRNNVIFMDFQALLAKDSRVDANGNFTFDFTTFDKFMGIFRDAGALGYIATPHLLEPPCVGSLECLYAPRVLEVLTKTGSVGSDGKYPVARTTVPAPSAEGAAYLAKVLPALKSHLESVGMLDRFYMAANDESTKSVHVSEAAWFYDIYRATFPGTSYKTVEAVNHMIPGQEDRLTTPTPDLKQYYENTGYYQELRAQGKDLWIYNANVQTNRYLNRFLSFHLDRTRLTPWYAWSIGATGYLHWGWNYWNSNDTNAGGGWIEDGNQVGAGAGDCWLVRPDKSNYSILNSVRSEAQRDGLEDVELLNQLKRDRPIAAKSLAATLISDGQQYTLSGADVVDRHRQLLELLEQDPDGPGGVKVPDVAFPYETNFAAADGQWVGDVEGSWAVSGGMYKQLDVGGSVWKPVAAGLKNRAYGDLVMTFDTQITAVNASGGDTNWAGAVVHSMSATDWDSGYLVGVRKNGGVFLSRSAWGSPLATGSIPNFNPNAMTRVKIVVSGTQLTVYANDNDAPVLVANDAFYRVGSVGLAAGGAAAQWDNVRVNPGVNRAEGALVTSTSSNQTGWSWSPRAAVDGDTSSSSYGMGWTSGAATAPRAESISINMRGGSAISRVDVFPRNDGANAGYGFPTDLTVETSTDGTTWSVPAGVQSLPASGASARSFSFPKVWAQYVRVSGNSSPESPGSNVYRAQIADIQVFGGNLALSKPVTATSSYEADGWSAKNVTDGSTWSASGGGPMGWSSVSNLGAQHSEALVVDLQGKSKVNKVTLWPRADVGYLGFHFPTKVTIETSADGSNWQNATVTNVGAPPAGPQDFPLAGSVDGVRFVRVTLQTRQQGSEHRAQIAELAVSGP